MMRWIQQAQVKHGALHKQLGYSENQKLPEGLLNQIAGAKIGTHVRGHEVTTLLKRRALFAVNVRK